MNRRPFLGTLAAAPLLLSGHVRAQAYPARPVRLVVPFPPGGSTDIAGRVLGQAMQKTLGQPVVVENRAGAAGAVGIDVVARALPDGYTLGVGGVAPTVTLELLGAKLPYSPQRDLVAIGHMGSLALVVAVKATLPVRTLAELLALAKTQPGRLSYGTSGNATPGHLGFELLKSRGGVAVVHIPYRGDAPLVADVLSGQIDIGLITATSAVAHARNPAVRLLAVTSATRVQPLPEIPTVAESGWSGYEAAIWVVLVAPAATPEPVVAQLNEALNLALADPAVQQQLLGQGLSLSPMTAPRTAQFLRDERAKWSAVIRSSRITLD